MHFRISVILAGIFALGLAVEKTSVAVLPFEAKSGVEPSVAQASTDLFTQELVNLKRVTVAERNKLNQILKEQTLQQTGCSDSSCAVKLGGILNVQKMMVGSITKVDKKYLVTLNVVDVETAAVEKSESFTVSSVSTLLENVKVMAQRLCLDYKIFGLIVKKNSDNTWAIDLSVSDGVAKGQRMMIVRFGEGIINKNTGDILGKEKTEIGYGRIVKADSSEKMSVLKPELGVRGMKEGDVVFPVMDGEKKEYQYEDNIPSENVATQKTEIAKNTSSTWGNGSAWDESGVCVFDNLRTQNGQGIFFVTNLYGLGEVRGFKCDFEKSSHFIISADPKTGIDKTRFSGLRINMMSAECRYINLSLVKNDNETKFNKRLNFTTNFVVHDVLWEEFSRVGFDGKSSLSGKLAQEELRDIESVYLVGIKAHLGGVFYIKDYSLIPKNQ